MEELDAFLDHQSKMGDTESEDRAFTISLEKARQKLRRYRLPYPAFYVLKIIQGAVGAGTAKIQIKLTRKEVKIWFEVPDRSFAVNEVLASLTNPAGQVSEELRHLIVGLSSSEVVAPISTIWAEYLEGESSALMICGETLRKVEAPEAPPKGFPGPGKVGYLFHLTKDAALLALRSATLPERTVIVERCRYAPVQICLDGKLLSARWSSDFCPKWMEKLSRPFTLAERFLVDQEGSLEFPLASTSNYKYTDTSGVDSRSAGCWVRKRPTPEPFLTEYLTVQGSPLKNPPRVARCRAAYAIPLSVTGDNCLILVKDGVVLQAVPVSSSNLPRVGAVALVDAGNLDLDLSEFGAVVNAAFERLVADAVEQWRTMIETSKQMIPFLHRVPPVQENKNKQDNSVSCGCLGGCLLPVVVGALLPGLVESMAGLWVALGLLTGGAAPFVVNVHLGRNDELRRNVWERLQALHRPSSDCL